MNRKLILTAGAFLLTAVSVLAGRASMKAPATSLGFTTTGGKCIALFSSGVPAHFTTVASGSQAQILTEGSQQLNVYTATCGTPVYFKN